MANETVSDMITEFFPEWTTRQRFDFLVSHEQHCGPFDHTKKQAKHQPICESGDCDAPAEIIWKDDPRNSDTWFYRRCDVCDEFLCPDCHDEGEDATLCIACLSREEI